MPPWTGWWCAYVTGRGGDRIRTQLGYHRTVDDPMNGKTVLAFANGQTRLAGVGVRKWTERG